MVTNLGKMMWERLTLFSNRNKKILPQRILVYRDGVSEGQFNIVVQEELPAIRLACTKFDTPQKKYRPAITIVICVSVGSIFWHFFSDTFICRASVIILASTLLTRLLPTTTAILARVQLSIAESPLCTTLISSCKVS